MIPIGVHGEGKYEWRVKILRGILVDEVKHSCWIGELLEARGIKPEILIKDERYWKETLPTMEGQSFEHLCAVGHLAESMRLDRIALLAKDERYKDVAKVFTRILPDEEFHTKLFAALSTPEAIVGAKENHDKGLNALGLVP
jgi:rubrerythrin